MVARSVSPPGASSPGEPLRVAVAADGTLAAILEPPRVRLLEVPSGTAFAEFGVDPDALASEIAWIGAPPRLLVLARHAAHSTAHLLDPYGPYGPRTLAKIQLPAPMRLFATVGGSALVVGAQGAAVLAASESHLMPYQFPARIMPVAAGAAAGQFVIALAGSIEEWDPQSRMPKRRLRLPRAAAITAIGGSERLVWMTTQQEPARIDVISLTNRGQPRAHDLPEPIARVAGHPRSDLVACIGAHTGRLYVVDLDGRAQLRVIEPGGIDRIDAAALVVGRMLGVLAAQVQHPIAIVPLDGRDLSTASGAGLVLPSRDPAIRLPLSDEPHEAARPSTWTGALDESARGSEPAEPAEPDGPDGPDGRRPEPGAAWRSIRLEPPSPAPQASSPLALSSPPRPPALRASPPPSSPPRVPAAPATARPTAPAPPVTPLFRPPADPAAPPDAASAPSTRSVPPASKPFFAWRDRLQQNRPRMDPTGPRPAPRAEPAGPPPRDARRSWRDEVAAWSRAVSAGAVDHDAPTAPAIDAVLARFALAPELRPVLAMLYGAHLCGERGVAPVDVARILDGSWDGSWDEALGRGELARRGVAEHSGSRVALSPLLLRVLDELPPVTGTLIGEPGPIALRGPHVIVAGDEPLPTIAARCLSHVGGAILAARDGADRAELLLEARAHGAAPMVRLAVGLEAAPGESAIFVVGDAALADRVGLPRLAQLSLIR